MPFKAVPILPLPTIVTTASSYRSDTNDKQTTENTSVWCAIAANDCEGEVAKTDLDLKGFEYT